MRDDVVIKAAMVRLRRVLRLARSSRMHVLALVRTGGENHPGDASICR